MNTAFLRSLSAALSGAAAFATLSTTASAAPLPRNHVELASTISVDAAAGTVVLPLYQGTAGGTKVYYIITEASDAATAKRLHVNVAPNIGAAFVQKATGDAESLSFAGKPDFSPERVFVPGPTGFPPKNAAPGAVGDEAYSPFVTLANGTTLNAPIVATGDGPFDVTTHKNTGDRVLAIDPGAKTVTILLAQGFFNGKRVAYLSTEASDPGVAAIERATYVKKLNGSGASSKTPIIALANGQTGAHNAQAQGLAHLALDGRLSEDATLAGSGTFGSPLNVLSTFPSDAAAAGYTPLWDANVGVWSKAAVAAKKNVQVKSLAQAFELSGAGSISTPDGKPLAPAGFVVNCPVIATVDAP